MAPRAHRIVAGLARTGFFTKGVLYMVVGWLAASAALGFGGRITSTDGALLAVLRQPYGRLLLLVAAVGLFGYALWRIVQAVFDPDDDGTGWKGLGLRATYLLRGLVHALLGWQAVRLYRGLRGSDGTEGQEEAVRALFALPLGEWALVLAGAGLVAYAGSEIWKAWQCRLARDVDTGDLRADAGSWAVTVSRFGIAARAVVFVVIGVSAIRGGISGRAADVEGTEGALRALARQPGDIAQWMFAVISVGLIAYGFYQLLHARYRQIRRVT